jgi:T4 RnlA family RNA ligase
LRQLFNELMALCGEPDSAFSFKDFVRDEQRFRIFNYRIASYTDFCKPGALEARGIMFLMDDDGSDNPIRIVCRPPMKFFNLNENPFTMNLDLSGIQECMTKMDGSLISSYIYGSHGKHLLGLKSKGALFSEQAQWAEEWLERTENNAFWRSVCDLTFKGWTVNMELVSPRNQIVLPYQREELVVLNLRNNETGLTIFKDEMLDQPYLPWVSSTRNVDVSKIPDMKGIEGFVLRFENGLLAKIKTDEYLALHKTKDSVTIPRRLFECVIMECTDDLKAMFKSDPLSLTRIKEMEEMVIPRYNHMVSSVEKFHAENKGLTRKDYAIKGQKELLEYFGLAMNMYLGKEPYYKDFAIKNYKKFGVKDVEENETE